MLEREREITLRFLAEPTDVNFGGKVHGGAVMKWIDQAGYACAVGWSGQYCVTVYVGGIRFHRPVLIGNMVEVSAKLIYTGKTSMHVAVEVSAGDPKVCTPRPRSTSLSSWRSTIEERLSRWKAGSRNWSKTLP